MVKFCFKRGKIIRIGVPLQSGSNRILKLMNRFHDKEKITEALLRLKKAFPKLSLHTHIIVGFPTETEEDFKKTLGFVSRNNKYIDVILPSESFCSIERNSYLYNHPHEFSILSVPHNIYWETVDGKNSYPERLRRFEEFCELALSLNMSLGSGYGKVGLNKERYLQNYILSKNVIKK